MLADTLRREPFEADAAGLRAIAVAPGAILLDGGQLRVRRARHSRRLRRRHHPAQREHEHAGQRNHDDGLPWSPCHGWAVFPHDVERRARGARRDDGRLIGTTRRGKPAQQADVQARPCATERHGARCAVVRSLLAAPAPAAPRRRVEWLCVLRVLCVDRSWIIRRPVTGRPTGSRRRGARTRPGSPSSRRIPSSAAKPPLRPARGLCSGAG